MTGRVLLDFPDVGKNHYGHKIIIMETIYWWDRSTSHSNNCYKKFIFNYLSFWSSYKNCKILLIIFSWLL